MCLRMSARSEEFVSFWRLCLSPAIAFFDISLLTPPLIYQRLVFFGQWARQANRAITHVRHILVGVQERVRQMCDPAVFAALQLPTSVHFVNQCLLEVLVV